MTFHASLPLLTYKYRLKDRRAAKLLRHMAVAVNQVWNYSNAYQRDIETRYRAGAPKREWPTHFDLTYLTAGTSKELGILAGTVSEVCRRYATARDAAKHSLRFRTSFGPRRALGWIPFRRDDRRIDGNSVIYLRKQFRWFGNRRRPLPATAKGGAFVEDALGRWWVTFHVEVAEYTTNSTAQIGIDLGLKSFATMSDGEKIEAPRYYRALEAKLATAQRAHNKQRVRRIHCDIANARKDFLHKLSARLVRENALIAVGDVSSSKLACTKMAKSVLDAGWSAFRSQLRYKSQQAGVAYLEVDERFTTQACSECGSIAGPRGRAGLNKREWDCLGCGASHDRDVNSAKVILSRALSAQGLDGESRTSSRIGTTLHTRPAG